jgi:hypothetical protein
MVIAIRRHATGDGRQAMTAASAISIQQSSSIIPIMRTVYSFRRRAALLTVAAVLFVGSALAAVAQNDMGSLADVAPDRAFAYLSGNLQPLHNHPAIYADSATGRFVVVGHGYRREFPLANTGEALKAYRNLLYDRNYEPDGKKRAKKRKSSEEEYQELLRMVTNELSDSAKSLFTSDQLDRFGSISPSAGYEYFSGYTGAYPNHPVIYAHLYGFTIVGRGFKKDMTMKEATKAFAEYLALVKGKGR